MAIQLLNPGSNPGSGKTLLLLFFIQDWPNYSIFFFFNYVYIYGLWLVYCAFKEPKNPFEEKSINFLNKKIKALLRLQKA
jgi:hypothetical protein